MSSILDSPDALAALQERKREVRKKLQDSRQQMTATASSLTGGSLPQAVGKLQGISRLVFNGLVIYRGFRLCSGFVTGLRSLFAPRKHRR